MVSYLAFKESAKPRGFGCSEWGISGQEMAADTHPVVG